MSVWVSWTPYSSHSVLYSSMEIVPSPLRSNFSNTFSNAVINTRGWFATFIISSTGWTQAATFVFYLQLLNLAHGVVSSSTSHYCGSAVVECWYFLSIYPLLCSDHSGFWAVNEISSIFRYNVNIRRRTLTLKNLIRLYMLNEWVNMVSPSGIGTLDSKIYYQ